jgi:BirA family biotin operon repressor/biotin-[acetyl-CoA-carboxylase] ligase
LKNHDLISKILSDNLGDIKVDYFSSIDSTNTYIIDTSFTHKYHLCYADIQTHGRGQRGGKWISSSNDNIYATLGFKCNFNVSEVALSSIKIALGVFDGIKKHIPANLHDYLKIKLPNDIYFQDKKLVGILIETKNIKHDSFDIVIGFGINVNMTDIDESIDREWTSLAILNGEMCDSSQILSSVVSSIVSSFYDDEIIILTKFKNCDYLQNKKISFYSNNIEYSGIYLGISNQLKIMVDCDDKLEFDISNVNKVRIVQS